MTDPTDPASVAAIRDMAETFALPIVVALVGLAGAVLGVLVSQWGAERQRCARRCGGCGRGAMPSPSGGWPVSITPTAGSGRCRSRRGVPGPQLIRRHGDAATVEPSSCGQRSLRRATRQPTVRFTGEENALDRPEGDWGPTKMAYLLHVSDPVVFFLPVA